MEALDRLRGVQRGITILLVAGLASCGAAAGIDPGTDSGGDPGGDGPGDGGPGDEGGGTPMSDHPFLIVTPSEYAGLRASASLSPWRELASDARSYAQNQTFDPGASDYQAKTRMTELSGALALSYMLDPQPLYLDKLRTLMGQWSSWYRMTAPSGSVTQVRWQQSAMVQTIIALDVMHDSLAEAELATIEDSVDDMIRGWWTNLSQDGTASTPGVTAIWALYAGDRGLFEDARDLFLERWFAELTPAGVFDSGPGYAWVRQGADRLSKYALVDVLEHTGEQVGLYSDPRVVGLHEWLFGGAFTPRRKNTTFGDSDPTRNLEGLQGFMPVYRAGRVSELAGRNAAWLMQGQEPRPLLANYVLMNDTLLDPEPPHSALYGDNASFWEAGGAVDSLMGSLWSPRSIGGHSHKDVNAVHLYAYGENVLRNVGFCGAGNGIDSSFDWDWVSNTAASSNTVSIQGQDHGSKIGGGLIEGVLAPGLDYAAASSGSAMSSATHVRSLLMIHGEAGLPGYFVLLDEVETQAGRTVCVDLHPDSSSISTRIPSTEFEASVRQLGSSTVIVDLFLATPPASTQLLDGGLCAFDGRDYVGRSLRACHVTDGSGRMHAVTLVVPSDATHARPNLSRLSAGGATGARVDYPGSVSDIVAESSGTSLVAIGGPAFQGLATHVRTVGGTVERYLVRRGSLFDDGALDRIGFESDRDLSLVVSGTEAWVNSDGATVDFFDPALTGRTWTSEAGQALSGGAGWVRVRLNAGRHGFDLVTGAAR
jgi:hypothetical protein